jgi:thiol-disulfide isomerase/thioredoxin
MSKGSILRARPAGVFGRYVLGLAGLLVGLGLLAYVGYTPPAKAASARDLGKRLDRLVHPHPEQIPALMKNGRPTLLYFSDKDCLWCLRSVPTIEALVKEFSDNANVFTVNPLNDDLGTVNLVAKHEVWGVPTFVFFDHQGRKVAAFQSSQRLERLKARLNRLIAAANKKSAK